MREPTDEELKEYADKLPRIYKYVLEAYASADSKRRRGEPLDEVEIRQWVTLRDDYYRWGDVVGALDKLEGRGFLTKELSGADPHGEYVPITGEPAYRPTELGERLITALTGVSPVRSVIPELPELSWSR
jgi:hypothetical protein